MKLVSAFHYTSLFQCCTFLVLVSSRHKSLNGVCVRDKYYRMCQLGLLFANSAVLVTVVDMSQDKAIQLVH